MYFAKNIKFFSNDKCFKQSSQQIKISKTLINNQLMLARINKHAFYVSVVVKLTKSNLEENVENEISFFTSKLLYKLLMLMMH